MNEEKPEHEEDELSPLHSVRKKRQDSRDKEKGSSSSMTDLRTAVLLNENQDFMRRRSRSAPLSVEATKVASELKRLSDSLHRTYSNKRQCKKDHRRHTFGVSRDRETKRQTFHFDYDKYDYQDGIHSGHSGTSV